MNEKGIPVLEKALEVFDRGQRWIVGFMAWYDDGEDGETETEVSSRHATHFCSVGGIDRALWEMNKTKDKEARAQALALLAQEVEWHTDFVSSGDDETTVIQFNDHWDEPWKVMDLFRSAIDRAKGIAV